MSNNNRVFLFMQGPHGPFFSKLGDMLRKAGAQVWRVGFNAGDQVFWRNKASYIPYRAPAQEWPDHFAGLCDQHNITDIVLYGDTRPIHAQAIIEARRRGITIHVFEEGYMRPYWITYERGGSNGHSRLLDMDLAQMRAALETSDIEPHLPPAHWGDMRHHVVYGALYHWFVMFANRRYRNFRPHREQSVAREFQLYLKRLLLMPVHRVERRIATMRVRMGGFPYHLALLQLEHDSNFRQHGPFKSTHDFLREVMRGFARGAPQHHHLVIKDHPLTDGRVPIQRLIRSYAADTGISGRVHYVRGGKLAGLIADARTAVTVNSTAGQQALWRGIPLKAFGRAVYSQPEFVSSQSLHEFFAHPSRPDTKAYKDYRRYLLETSQLPGGYYSARGRRQLLRHVIDMMLSQDDPYDALNSGRAVPRHKLRLVQ